MTQDFEMFENKTALIGTNQEFKKYMDFLGQEILFTNYSLSRMQRIEDKISKEYFALINTFNMQPLNSHEWIYYSKDPQLTSKSIFDIYRVRTQRNTVKIKNLLLFF